MISSLLNHLTRRHPGSLIVAGGWKHWTLGIAMTLGLPACSMLKSPDLSQDKRSFKPVTVADRSGAAPANPQFVAPPQGPSGPVPRMSGIQQVGYQVDPTRGQPVAPSNPAPFRHQFVAAEERTHASPFDTSADDARSRLALEYPDEYLFDGGDRSYPVHYSARGRSGLETEDTIAEFRDDAGKLRVKATNRVAIYAPRFANVTTISHVSEDSTVGRLADSTSTLRNSALRNRVVPNQEGKPTKLQAIVERVRGSEVKDRQHTRDTRQEFRLAANVHTLYPETYANFARTGELLNSNEARLAEALQSAMNLTRKENPVAMAKLESSADIKSYFRDTEFVGLKENPLSAGRLRIVKLADKHVAESGDVITFTIRFDNQGHRPLSDLVIVDNLTPRLQYVDDSATSDRAGRLVTEENGEGSLVLRWEFDEPLPGRTGGVVTFQVRVK